MANSILDYSPADIARILGGKVYGSGNRRYIQAPAPGHSAKDDSFTLETGKHHPGDFIVKSHCGDDELKIKDYVREKLSLPAFSKTSGKRRPAKKPRATVPPIQNPKPIPESIDGMTPDERLEAAMSGSSSALSPENVPGLKFVEAYLYADASGKGVAYKNCRYLKNDGAGPKTFRPWRLVNGKWIMALDGLDQIPYRLDEFAKHPHAPIVVCEGEKDANNLRNLGYVATNVAAGWWQKSAKYFPDREAIILGDFNQPGTVRAMEAANALHGTARSIKIIFLPGLDGSDNRKDVSDWLKIPGNDEKKLADICNRAPLWNPGDVVEGFAAAESIVSKEKETEAGTDAGRPLILSSAEFVKDFTPPDYVIHGILQRGFLYSFTGKTGAGKTAIMLLTAAHVALGNKLGDRDVEQGRVLYLAGENADDVRMRWIAYGQQMGFDLDTIAVNFIPGVFKISEMRERIRIELQKIGNVSLIIVDTSAAYFEGDDENDNKQFGDYARLILRPLTKLPGNPCIVAACHPVKNAADSNLSPRGGGAFVNEVDGNLTSLKSESEVVEVHWQIKFRGPEFSTIYFSLRTVTHEKLKDTKGGLIPTVTASFLTDQGRTDMLVERSREDELLILFLDPTACKESQRDLAKRLGWLMKDNKPHQVQVGRTLKTLEKTKLIIVERGEIHLTKKGEEAVKQLASKKEHGTDFVSK